MKALKPLDPSAPLPVPPEASSMATSLAAAAITVQRAQGLSTSVASLDQAITAATRMQVGARAMLVNLKRQRTEAIQAQHEQAAADAARVKREAAIRRQRGMPPLSTDLQIPVPA